MTREHSQWRPHPWHGLSPGPDTPKVVTVFVEITPFDHVKYEIDKISGFLRIDRPQYSSSLPPSVYGFIPRTFAGRRVASLMPGARRGDEDPLDICVISSHAINKSEVLLSARVVGGIPMLDAETADDKIVGVLVGDAAWNGAAELEHLPSAVVDQLVHYFSTYKRMGRPENTVQVCTPYGKHHAQAVILASIDDYVEAFGT